MRKLLLMALLVASPLAWLGAQEEAIQEEERSPARQFEDLKKAFEKAQQEFYEAYGQAKTDAEKQKLVSEKMPRPAKWAPRFMAIGEKHPRTPGGLSALMWVVQSSQGGGAKALALIREHHIDSVKLKDMVGSLVYNPTVEAREFLVAVIEKNPHKKVKGPACYSLGKMLMRASSLRQRLEKDEKARESYAKAYGEETITALMKMDSGKLEAEAERCLTRVQKEYAGLERYGRTLGDLARGDLFEMKNLTVGKVAPDIEGSDLDGVAFKLSDYRGKVVMLDFWGHW